MSRAAAVLLLAAGLLASCALFGAEEEVPSPGNERAPDLGVIDDEPGDFDPAAAVDDDEDTLGIEGLDEVLDGERQPEEDTGAQAAARTADPQEVAQRQEQIVEAINESGGEDERAKTAVARNAPAEEVGAGESWGANVLDVGLELLLLVIAAVLLTALIQLVARRPVAGTLAAVVGLAAVVFVVRAAID